MQWRQWFSLPLSNILFLGINKINEREEIMQKHCFLCKGEIRRINYADVSTHTYWWVSRKRDGVNRYIIKRWPFTGTAWYIRKCLRSENSFVHKFYSCKRLLNNHKKGSSAAIFRWLRENARDSRCAEYIFPRNLSPSPSFLNKMARRRTIGWGWIRREKEREGKGEGGSASSPPSHPFSLLAHRRVIL